MKTDITNPLSNHRFVQLNSGVESPEPVSQERDQEDEFNDTSYPSEAQREIAEARNEALKVIEKATEEVSVKDLALTTKSEEIIKILAEDSDPSVRKRVAGNEHIPKDILNNLLKDPDPEVRIQAIMNLKMPPEIARTLQKNEKDESVLKAINARLIGTKKPENLIAEPTPPTGHTPPRG